MYTVLGLRAIGHRAALVAAPRGRAAAAHVRRARPDPAGAAQRNRPGRGVAAVARPQAAAARRRPRPRPARGGDGRHGAVDRRAAPRPRARRVASHRVPHRAATRSRAGSTRRSTASSPTAARSATGWSPTASRSQRSRSSTRASTSSGSSRMPHGNVHAALYLPTRSPVVGNVGALVAAEGAAHLIDAAALVVKQVPDVRFVILGEGELRPQLEKQIKHKHLERHVFLAGFRADVLELIKDFDVFAMSSITRRDVHGAGRRDGRRKAGRGDHRRRRPGGAWSTAKPASWCRHTIRRRWPRASCQLLKDQTLRRRMGEAGLARARALFTVERMVQETAGGLRAGRPKADLKAGLYQTTMLLPGGGAGDRPVLSPVEADLQVGLSVALAGTGRAAGTASHAARGRTRRRSSSRRGRARSRSAPGSRDRCCAATR